MAENQVHDPNAFLMGGGVASAFGKETPLGTIVGGVICEVPEVKQQTDIMTGLPETWENGDPKLQLLVTVQAEGVAVTTEDDGKRRFYIKGSKASGSQSIHDAVASAVKDSGAKGLEVGGTLKIQFIGTEPSTQRGFSDKKLYRAKYVAPVPKAAADFLGVTGAAFDAAAAKPVLAAVPSLDSAPVLTPEALAAQNRAYAEAQLGARADAPIGFPEL